MPDKPICFGIKVWMLASSKSRFVWRIEVYFGEGTWFGEHGLGYHVVERMIVGLHHWDHCLVVDNLFGSVTLFHELMVQGFWATSTVRRRRKNMPGVYREPNSDVKGSILIKTHVHQQMGVVSWQELKLVMLISIAAPPWASEVTVLWHTRTAWGPTHNTIFAHAHPIYGIYARCRCNWSTVREQLLPASVPQMVDKTVPFSCGPNHGECVRHIGEGDGGPWSLGWYSHGFKIAVGRHLIEDVLNNRGPPER